MKNLPVPPETMILSKYGRTKSSFLWIRRHFRLSRSDLTSERDVTNGDIEFCKESFPRPKINNK